jgi:hypothetical protein
MFSAWEKWWSDRRAGAGAIRVGAVLALAFCLAGMAQAQTVPAGDEGGLAIWAGTSGSSYYVQYGERKMVGVTAFVDADTRRRLGIEVEGQWVEFRQSAGVHIETYSIGARYHFSVGRFQPYVKGLAGFGDFNFPYNLATGRFLVATAGGGIDYRLSRKIEIRAVDCEYQNWPKFTFGNMTTLSVSVGLRMRIF